MKEIIKFSFVAIDSHDKKDVYVFFDGENNRSFFYRGKELQLDIMRRCPADEYPLTPILNEFIKNNGDKFVSTTNGRKVYWKGVKEDYSRILEDFEKLPKQIKNSTEYNNYYLRWNRNEFRKLCKSIGGLFHRTLGQNSLDICYPENIFTVTKAVKNMVKEIDDVNNIDNLWFSYPTKISLDGYRWGTNTGNIVYFIWGKEGVSVFVPQKCHINGMCIDILCNRCEI